MRNRILSSGFHDLEAGRSFYERQGEGLGEYFQPAVLSLQIKAGSVVKAEDCERKRA